MSERWRGGGAYRVEEGRANPEVSEGWKTSTLASRLRTVAVTVTDGVVNGNPGKQRPPGRRRSLEVVNLSCKRSDVDL